MIWSIEDFFELLSLANKGEKDKNESKKGNFLENEQSLKKFNLYTKCLA